MELSASNVWTILAASLVLLMTPGLAFFYSGMTRAKAALNMIMMSMISMGLVSVVWALWGYSTISGDAMISEFIGSPFTNFGLTKILQNSPQDLLTVGYSATFAIIAVAIVSGSVADRTRFSSWVFFIPLWITAVYCPLAYMVWGGGFFSQEGWFGRTFGEPIDFAGGLVIHINAGIAGLILAIVVGARQGFGKDPHHRPHNLPFVMLGAAILWFGWFGFNAGAAEDASQAGVIWINTLLAPCAAMSGWSVLERVRDGHATSLGLASGIVAGLVGITPACANVSPLGAIAIGLLCGATSAWAVGIKYKLGYDDSLDVVGVHLVSGIVGTLAIGLFAIPSAGEAGLFYGGGIRLLGIQFSASVLAILYSAMATIVVVLIVNKVLPMRVSPQQEIQGIDLSQHAETAYSFAQGASGTFSVNRREKIQ